MTFALCPLVSDHMLSCIGCPLELSSLYCRSGRWCCPRARPRRPRDGGHDRRPRLRAGLRPPPEEVHGGTAPRPPPGRPRDLGLHRGLRPRPRRPPRRQAGDHPLGVRGPELAARFPEVEVDASVLYVDEGDVMTSAGVSAGLDLALHVIRSDFGAAAGAAVARWMVAPPYREGGQAQFFDRRRRSAPPRRAPLARADPRLGAQRLDEPLDVAAMARHAAVSPAPSPAASARRPGPLRCSGCSPSGSGGAPPARGERPADRRDRLARRLRHRRLAARALPPCHLDQPERLPALVPAGRSKSAA